MAGVVGTHAFSRDAVTWAVADVEPYTLEVKFTDGSAKNMTKRERPQLLLSDNGEPLYFSSGVQDHDDHTYTLVVKLKSKGLKSGG